MTIEPLFRFLGGPFVLLLVCLCPVARPAEARLGKLIRDLDDPRYRVREQATRALEKMGDLPVPALRKALERPASLEARLRMERILQRREAFHANRARLNARSRVLARDLLRAFRMIEVGHVTPTSQQQLAAWAVQGMYQEANEAIPPGINARLKNLKADAEALRALLHDARLHLGLRQEFDYDRDLDICLRAVFARLEPGVKEAERSRYIRPEEVRLG